VNPARRSMSACGPLCALNACFAHIVGVVKPWAGGRGSSSSLLEKGESRASSPALALWRACGARQLAGSMPACCQSLSPKNDRSRKAWGRPALGCVCDGEERSPGVGARTRALRELTRRNCPSATNAVSEASFAARPQGEYRSVPCAAGRRIRTPAPAGPMPCIHHTAGKALYSRTVANAHNGPRADGRLIGRRSRRARRSH
jgi:hypothetical protein